MKELRNNMRRVGVLIICLFVGLGAWYGATVYDQGNAWASNVYNTRLAASATRRGAITDREGIALAYTAEDGTRVYLENETARRAMSQTVGDSAGMSGTGVETYYASTLLDVSGSLFERLSEVFGGSAHVGSSVQITASAKLTAYISHIFPAGYNGAVVIMNYKTGEILAMVSKPDYDPAAIGSRSEAEEVADSAYLNRVLQGRYTPGSVFKIVTLTSALMADTGVMDLTYSCNAVWEYGEGRMVCNSGNTSHGTLTLKSAFARSCNVTFGKLAYALGRERMLAASENMGFNDDFDFNDITLYMSQFPAEMTKDNDLIWAGIGQGKVLVTPLHMCMISASVANGGVMMEPKLVREIETSLGVVTQSLEAEIYRRVMPEDVAATVAEYMLGAVQKGTARNAAVSGYTVCGKTGSAQVTDDDSRETNAWFTGFVLDDDNPYAIAVVIEEGGAGSDLASSLASKALAYAIEVIQ